MFKLIGIIVVCLVVFTGFSSLQKWYEGKSTPAETVVNLRDQVGNAITPTEKTSKKPNSDLNQENEPIKESQNNNNKEEASSFSTEDAARNLIKHAAD